MRLAKPVLLSLLTVLALSLVPSAQARQRICPSISTKASRYAVFVESGSVSCKEAARVLRIYFRGGGRKHVGDSEASSWSTIGNWQCGSGTDGGGCQRRRDGASILAQTCSDPGNHGPDIRASCHRH